VVVVRIGGYTVVLVGRYRGLTRWCLYVYGVNTVVVVRVCPTQCFLYLAIGG